MTERRWPKIWLVLLAVDTAVETWALRRSRHEATLSHALRTNFRTDTRSGRIVFAAAWVALTAWLLPHIMNDRKT